MKRYLSRVALTVSMFAYCINALILTIAAFTCVYAAALSADAAKAPIVSFCTVIVGILCIFRINKLNRLAHSEFASFAKKAPMIVYFVFAAIYLVLSFTAAVLLGFSEIDFGVFVSLAGKVCLCLSIAIAVCLALMIVDWARFCRKYRKLTPEEAAELEAKYLQYDPVYKEYGGRKKSRRPRKNKRSA